MHGGDDIGAVVVCLGSHTCRVGEGGDGSPKFVFPTSAGYVFAQEPSKENVVGNGLSGVGETADAMVIDNKNDKQNKFYYFGTDIMTYKPNMEIINPISQGLITDWEAVEKLLDHALMECLRIDPAERPILLSEPSYNLKEQREKVTELIFEKFQSPGLFLAKDATLTAFANRKSTALVIDSGADYTTVIPVYEGYTLQKTLFKSNVAGRFLNDALCTSLKDYLPERKVVPKYLFSRKQNKGKWEITPILRPNTPKSYHDFHVNQVLEDLKITACRVADSPEAIPLSTNTYELPDGSTIQLDPKKHKVTELMFQNIETPTQKSQSYQQLIHSCLLKCDVNIRKDLAASIVVAGGNSLFPGFVERLQKEIETTLPKIYEPKIIASSDNLERVNSSWIGGSILASLGTFHQMWISKKEFDEFGKSIVHRKCP